MLAVMGGGATGKDPDQVLVWLDSQIAGGLGYLQCKRRHHRAAPLVLFESNSTIPLLRIHSHLELTVYWEVSPGFAIQMLQKWPVLFVDMVVEPFDYLAAPFGVRSLVAGTLMMVLVACLRDKASKS